MENYNRNYCLIDTSLKTLFNNNFWFQNIPKERFNSFTNLQITFKKVDHKMAKHNLPFYYSSF